MLAEKRYLRLKGRLERMARGYSNRDESLAEELMSVGDLAVAEGLAVIERARGYDIDDWLCLRVRNAMTNHLRGEKRRKAWQASMDNEALERLASRRRGPDLIDLSDDARAVAEVLISESYGDLRRAIERSCEYLYVSMGWKRTWNAIDELRTIYGRA